MKLRTMDLVKFIRERHRIYLRRQEGKPKPWTKDPILQQYRFCNVYRELDTVTQWIAYNWRKNRKDDWFAMVVARLVNWPDSLAEIGYPVPFDINRFRNAMNLRLREGKKVFTGAYMIHADAVAKGTKADYLARQVLLPMWEAREYLCPKGRWGNGKNRSEWRGDTLASFHARLMEYRDMGSFMAGQIVCDTKYTNSLAHAPDWHTWAARGPGSARGLNRVYGLDPKLKMWNDAEWLAALDNIRPVVNALMVTCGMEKLHAQDLQNCLCEFDKYERVRLGEGRPRSLYNGTKETTRVVMEPIEL